MIATSGTSPDHGSIPNQQYIALHSERHAGHPEPLVMSMITLFVGGEEFISTTEGHRVPDNLAAGSKPYGAYSVVLADFKHAPRCRVDKVTYGHEFAFAGIAATKAQRLTLLYRTAA
jgi:hypothetical protein